MFICVLFFRWEFERKTESFRNIQKQLERYAKDSRWRLDYAIKTGGFFYSRAALNIWKDNAMVAGMFDQELFNKYKRKIYEKSVNENLKWFEIFFNQNYLRDARVCLQLYKLHSEEINIFDEQKYEEMSKRLRKWFPADNRFFSSVYFLPTLGLNGLYCWVPSIQLFDFLIFNPYCLISSENNYFL